jgi:hypothetical protein
MFMGTKVKIKISDDIILRNRLDELYENTNQVTLAQWSLCLAKHILEITAMEYWYNQIVLNGFAVNEQWQNEKARMHDVRQAGFKIHQLAKQSENEIEKAALRVLGQAVATGHMREHAMVASDYAVKVINLLCPNDIIAVSS